MNQCPPGSQVFPWGRFEFFRKFVEIFASRGGPPVSTTPVENFATSFDSVVDTGGKVSTIPAAYLPPVSVTPVVNLELGISPRLLEKIRNGPNGILWGWGETD